MNNYDVSGILQTYAERARKARDTKQLREVIKELKEELDLRKVHIEKGEVTNDKRAV